MHFHVAPGELADPIAKPARGAMVAVVDDASDELLVTVSTADDGTYVAHYNATAMVRIVTYSRSRAEARPARVRDDDEVAIESNVTRHVVTRSVAETVSVAAPRGTLKFKILEIKAA